MSLVVLERLRAAPLTLAELAAQAWEGGWCLEMYRVAHRVSFLSRDGHRVVCVFDAPDAEAVRAAMRDLGDVAERVWAASAHAPPDQPAHGPLAHDALVAVERDFAAPVEFAALQAREDEGAWCLQQHRVRFVRSFFSTDRRRMLCLYDAPDAEAVRRAQEQTGLPVSAVWAAQVFAAASPRGH
jgi:hypothetical protein